MRKKKEKSTWKTELNQMNWINPKYYKSWKNVFCFFSLFVQTVKMTNRLSEYLINVSSYTTRITLCREASFCARNCIAWKYMVGHIARSQITGMNFNGIISLSSRKMARTASYAYSCGFCPAAVSGSMTDGKKRIFVKLLKIHWC